MKKYIKTIIVVAIMASLVVGYFIYLSNVTPKADATQKQAETMNEELSYLLNIDLNKNYPESVREVVKLYARITKAYYAYDLTEEQIENLGKQARIIFDDELKATQTESGFLEELKKDIANYRAANIKINDYKIQSAINTNYNTFKAREYSSIVLCYYIRENSSLHNSYTKFTLRKDDQGKWRILFWELTDEQVIQ